MKSFTLMSAFLSENISTEKHFFKSYATRAHVTSEEREFSKIFFQNESFVVRCGGEKKKNSAEIGTPGGFCASGSVSRTARSTGCRKWILRRAASRARSSFPPASA